MAVINRKRKERKRKRDLERARSLLARRARSELRGLIDDLLDD